MLPVTAAEISGAVLHFQMKYEPRAQRGYLADSKYSSQL
jgi:hypothetical protein